MRLVFVAAEPREFTGVLTRAEQSRRARIGVDWARTARLAGHEVMLVANGIGRVRAAAAAEAAAEAFGAEGIVSTGFCGALAPELEIGDIVTASSVENHHRQFLARTVSSARVPHSGVVRTIDHVAQTAEEKSRLRTTGAAAVEMEAAGVAARAEERGLPFYCVRAVTDLAEETLANDFNRALRSAGYFDTMLILRNSLRDPLVRVPELLRLRERCFLAANSLGEFFAGCRF
jgi:nucleoside phosphorylase